MVAASSPVILDHRIPSKFGHRQIGTELNFGQVFQNALEDYAAPHGRARGGVSLA
jgi:hypothetical protein